MKGGCVFAGLVGVALLLAGGLCGLYFTADMKQPGVSLHGIAAYPLVKGDSLRTYGGNWLRLTASGLWELHVQGTGFERGVAAGKLTEELLHYQEKVFVDKIREFIPSDGYLKWLRFLLVVFNRKLGDYVPEENREEIYGISLSCSHDYDAIGTPYQRQLNYHAAHDIGHAMQDYMLVGCSSFAVWGKEGADSSLVIGRNFDFYMGDDFARHKVVSFFRPTEGYRFASVGWAGMTGVLSGMNETGLTVTINAAKSSVPLYAAMPISLLAREILQYASTIDEAYVIASRRRTFVAESLLIGSAADGRAAVIEKSVDRIALFRPETERIVCTNHYQSEAFAADTRNAENIATSDSPYRYERMNELLDACRPVDATKAASVLRNRFGKQGKEIGLANEKAINQFIAHHSVIFKPESRLMWVSTAPWQSGAYVAYDLNRIFSRQATDACQVDSLAIAPDTLLHSPVYQRLLTYRRLSEKVRMSIRNHTVLPDTVIENLIAGNPELYNAWLLAGDYRQASGDREKAVAYWEKALTKEIPKAEERAAIEKKIKKLKR
ncbi:MAG: C45 family peptidase [Tannerellaceae bacterium]|jgi:hypothetical protein|nr:C45 family peptidase [Tannerellaceae bacterium]